MGPKISPPKHTCPRCQIGTLQPIQATYTTVYRGALLSVPNITAWNCDICGFIEYDDEMMAQLEAMTGEYPLNDDAPRQSAKPAALDADGEPGEGKRSTRIKP
ncbi:MAG: YgiT-type zinc finger protein [Anaerolineae bacterium]|nr:YgiT-type zinc finger protein [Anaerolineae bacterium]NUQ05973.1 YgiT-type zinc finger protein [Anaerolineae bacterium]